MQYRSRSCVLLVIRMHRIFQRQLLDRLFASSQWAKDHIGDTCNPSAWYVYWPQRFSGIDLWFLGLRPRTPPLSSPKAGTVRRSCSSSPNSILEDTLIPMFMRNITPASKFPLRPSRCFSYHDSTIQEPRASCRLLCRSRFLQLVLLT